MPQTASVEPTARSMPPVIMTATWPSAMMAMKAKLRVTLKKFSSFQNEVRKDGSTTVMTIGIRKTAIVTQKAWFETILWARLGRCAAGAVSMPGALVVMLMSRLLLSRSCRPYGAGDEARHLFGARLADGLVGDLVAAAQHHDPVGDGEH